MASMGQIFDELQNSWGSSGNHVRRYLEYTARMEQLSLLHILEFRINKVFRDSQASIKNVIQIV